MKKQLEKKRYETPELYVDEYVADTMIASVGNNNYPTIADKDNPPSMDIPELDVIVP